MKPTTTLRKPKVLAVDDYPANIIALEAVLSDQYTLIEANSGAEALRLLEIHDDIAVILMDLQMPEMDGYEAASKIKKMNRYQDVPIIFITAVYKEDPFVKRGYEAGGVDYFSKPFDPEILKMKVGVYAAFRDKHNILKDRENQILETEELLKVGRKLSAVLEGLPVGVLIADVQGRICQMNQEVSLICEGTGSDDQDAYGEALGWWDASGQMIKDENGPLSQALRFGKTTQNQVQDLKCVNGTIKQILGSASPLLGLDGHIAGAVVVIQDVTESKKIEDVLKSQITKLVSAGLVLESGVKH